MNSVLNSSIANCDKDVGDGAAYAQVFHAINKRTVKIDAIKWGAKSEYEYTMNYNIVQKAMAALKINKIIPSEALMKGKPLDNIEFCQWLKHYYSNVGVVEDYDGYAVREASAPGTAKKSKKWMPMSGDAPAAAPAKRPASKPAAKAKPMAANQERPTSRVTSGAGSAADAAALKAAEETVAAQKEELSELNLNVDALTKERDFYFGKLRDVEIMIQEREGEEGIDESTMTTFESIKAILYATDDAEAATEEY